MDIRLATPEDAEVIRAIYNLEVTESTVTLDLVPRSSAEQLEWLAAHAGVHPAIVAIDGGAVIGFGSLNPYRSRPAYSTTVEDSVYVGRDWRGQGVGRALLHELVTLATSHGFHTIIARAIGGHEASIGLHRACGFNLVGVEREVGRKLGSWLDIVELQRML
ncbi:MAG TPA: GNAT family N-acetyltransferase [Acidimicrobiales bacterium]|nr:GNAT family N-acetyltransferase [Acidimicrobiales bacterium]